MGRPDKSVEERVRDVLLGRGAKARNLNLHGIREDDLTRDTRLHDDLGLDSLHIVEMTMDLEDEFEIQIPDSESAKLKTVGQVVDYVTARMVA